MDPGKVMVYKKYFKRFIDLFVSITVLIVFSPLLILIYGLVRLIFGSPALFIQTRVGLDEKPFKLIKFRTMVDLRDKQGNLLPDEQRLNRFGLFLRKTGLDELPELVNVIRGEMSLVGPRPLLVEYLSEYSEYHKQRHHVRPGVTGLAQVNGRNTTTWEERLDYDVEYVNTISFLCDLKIVLKTIAVIVMFKGATPKNKAVMDEYKRNEDE